MSTAVDKVKTPELDKMAKVKDKSQAIGSFLDWLQQEKEVRLTQLVGDNYVPFHFSMESLLAEYFEINLNKVEKERQALLAALRG